MKPEEQLIVGISGASGLSYGREFVRELIRQQMHVHLIVSAEALLVWRAEIAAPGETTQAEFEDWLGVKEAGQQLRVHAFKDLTAPPASGTFRCRGMAIVPCSMHMVASLAAGLADNLITRAADVCLKERRPLVVAPRETPFNLTHLRNLVRLAEAGATIAPAMPGFYHRPQTIDDLIQHFVMKLCDLFSLPCSCEHRWRGEEE